MVSAGSGGFGPVRQGQGAVVTLTADDADAIRREVPGIKYLSPGINTRQQVVAATSNWNTQIQGTGPELAAIRSWPTQFGSFFTEDDVTARARLVREARIERSEARVPAPLRVLRHLDERAGHERQRPLEHHRVRRRLRREAGERDLRHVGLFAAQAGPERRVDQRFDRRRIG